jgi:hypothetical protein
MTTTPVTAECFDRAGGLSYATCFNSSGAREAVTLRRIPSDGCKLQYR